MKFIKRLPAKQKMILFEATSIFIICAIFNADRLLKDMFINNLVTQSLVPGLLEFTRHENHGLIGNLPVARWLVICFSGAVILFLIYALRLTLKNLRLPQTIALSFIIGGALGNLYDRIILGYVFDWILLLRTSIVNLADISIFMGLIMYLLTIKKKHRLNNEKPLDSTSA